MKNIKLTFSILLLVFVAVNSVASAQMQGGTFQHKERMFKELNLTAEQQAKLTENRKAQRETMEKLFKAIREKEEKLREAFKDPQATRETVEPITREIKTLQAELIDSRVNGILEVKKILTPEQFAKFNQAMEKRKEGMKERHSRLRERRPSTER